MPPSAAFMRTEPAGGGPRALSDEESTLAALSLAGALKESAETSPLWLVVPRLEGLPPDDAPAAARAPWSELTRGALGAGAVGELPVSALSALSAALSEVGAAAAVRTTELLAVTAPVEDAPPASIAMPDCCD